MKLVSALVGLAALGGVVLSTETASAMPVAIPGQASQASNLQQAAYVCNGWGHCWDRPGYGYGYYHPHPHYWGGWGWRRGWGHGWHHWHRHYGGWGWHHWHPHYYGSWGWQHWHHWHQW